MPDNAVIWPRALEPGMLLLDPDYKGHPVFWSVVSPRTLRAHFETFEIKVTLKKSGLPKGWIVVNNATLADYLCHYFEGMLLDAAGEEP